MFYQTLIRGTLLAAASTLLTKAIYFPNIMPLAGALLTWAILLGGLNIIPAPLVKLQALECSGSSRSTWTVPVSTGQGISL